MADAIFLDVNVFMYAAGAPHPYKDVCVQILADVETGRLPAAVNTEVFQELLYRYAHINLADKGILLCREILRYPLTILPVTPADIHLAVELFAAHRTSGLKPRDAIHAATMQTSSLSRLISTDGDFDRLGFVTRINPSNYTSPHSQ